MTPTLATTSTIEKIPKPICQMIGSVTDDQIDLATAAGAALTSPKNFPRLNTHSGAGLTVVRW